MITVARGPPVTPPSRTTVIFTKPRGYPNGRRWYTGAHERAAGAGAGVGRVRDGAAVVGERWLTGGIDRSNHVVTLTDGREFVLRRWTRPDWRVTDPDFDVAREATALRLLERAGARTPRLIATDPDAETPALLMTKLPGGLPPTELSDVESFVSQLATAEAEIHRIEPGELPPYRPYHRLVDRIVPADAREQRLWLAAFDHLASQDEPRGTALIHRDYHPANTLWEDGRLTGVVDWAYASVGHPDMDAAHLRVNLTVSYGRAVAEAYLDARGGEYDRYWDVRVIIDFIEGLDPGEAMEPYLPELGHHRTGRLVELEGMLTDALS